MNYRARNIFRPMTFFVGLLCFATYSGVRAADARGAGKPSENRTVESAHEFLKSELENGAQILILQDIQEKNEYIAGYAGSGCNSTFKTAQGTPAVIDWSRVSKVESIVDRAIYYYEVQIYGNISIKGQLRPHLFIKPESDVLSARMTAAMDFLRTSCDTTSKTGF